MTSSEIRQQFIDFFVQKHGHTFVPSSPVVPHDDPTLLFTNAGMNQFKPYFLGQAKAPWPRVANTQKCIRAGGKHNDLDDVGRSRRHHTFFEMLGNWSFGDYFKRDAIAWSWELLTKVWKLDPTRLHVTVHAGDAAIGVPRDEEAANLWREVAGIAEDHIHYGNTKDNFWEMGETGPCGPCTEIFVDRTPEKTGGPSVLSGEDPRVMEIWNNVFIQYNRNPDKSLTPLPAQHVDTGMGLERIIQVLQGKDDNYGIDLFDPFWAKLKELSGITYSGKYPKSNSADPAAEAADAQLRHDIAFRVIADHIRCLTFALTDGAVPSNEGRGYVLRRILRRAVRFGRQQLELKEPFLHSLVPVVVEAMGGAFPELKKDAKRVAELIRDEEVSFGRTLDRGIELFNDAAEVAGSQWQTMKLRGPGGEPQPIRFDARVREHMKAYPKTPGSRPMISAADAFKLHDTYGFPIDLTRIMAEERGFQVDIDGYENLMAQAKELARSGGKETDSRIFELPPHVMAMAQFSEPTDDSAKYEFRPIQAVVEGIWDGSNVIDATHGAEAAGKLVAVKLDRTNFYAEMGGQIGDTGALVTDTAELDVVSTRVTGQCVLHVGRMIRGTMRVGDRVTATVSPARPLTEKNHTTTHLANWVLREVLGDDVQQKGSLVDPEKLRFDFSHGKALSEEELARVETLVNEGIAKKLPVYAETAPQEQALKIHGLRAVFGEKYPPMVRVVSVGVPVKELLADPGNAKWREFSIEFCGGTHLVNAGAAETFAVTAEESVSKGIRRIVALTGDAAKQAMAAGAEIDGLIAQAKAAADENLPAIIASLQKAVTGTIPLRAKRRAQAAVTELQSRYKAHQKAASKAAGAAKIDVAAITGELFAAASDLGGGKLVVGEVPGASDEQLRSAVDSLKTKAASYAVMVAAAADGKVTFVAAVSDDLVAKGLKAGDWIKDTAKVAGGGGGGRPQMAQGSGKDASKLGEALVKARAFAEGAVK